MVDSPGSRAEVCTNNPLFPPTSTLNRFRIHSFIKQGVGLVAIIYVTVKMMVACEEQLAGG